MATLCVTLVILRHVVWINLSDTGCEEICDTLNEGNYLNQTLINQIKAMQS